MIRTLQTLLKLAFVAALVLGTSSVAQTVVPIPPTDEDSDQMQPYDSIKQASYGIFSIDPSSVGGQLQVRQTPEGMAEFVLTLTNSVAGDLHAAAVYEGDCGPDRALLTKLARVGDSTPEDPFVSITKTELTYESVVEGDYFVMIFGDELDTSPLACGEVGLGANRTDY